MTQRILVPVDGSEGALHAINEAVQLAKQFQTTPEIVLLHVKHSYPLVTSMGAVPFNIDEVLEEESKEALKRARTILQEADIPHQTESRSGDPATEICELAKEVDMVVMGSRGLGPFREVVLGSVSSKVLHHSKVPVTIVK
ncbi:universal stress protein [Aureibacillus halotolerans]|uniref:Nucleotide-binding universal stress UspA family protein n=1 Tax=Aureibacillus halotolerans TaxID=1508390 RepID=A0A4R6TTZ4_9BACI|nr:universal stress protein [Aureibacillus halotolerans]TDQ37178.1 nucleotide-binding universal stress UspA family protein [Aureibacillus halotolerans]